MDRRAVQTVSDNLQTLNQKSFDVHLELDGTPYHAAENIGCGTYGVVCSAIDTRTNERVAIKKISNIFNHPILAKRTYREIKILQHFSHENIINIRELLAPSLTGANDFNDVYIVLDLMEADLHQVIRSQQTLSDEHIRYFLYQILRGLKYIHSANVLHRDLKPSNLLVNENCDLKIGMARTMCSSDQDHSLLMTQYVATRWYRSPELMLFRQQYTAAVDVWSVGCILAEMLGRKPIFPGQDLLNQLMLIIGILGSPSEDFINMAHSERIKDLLHKLEKKATIPLAQIYPTALPKSVRLLEKLLKFDPRQRITVDDALKDHYLNKYHAEMEEPICEPAFGFEFEQQDLDMKKLRVLIYKELTHRKSDRRSPHSTHEKIQHDIDVDVSVARESMDTTSPTISNHVKNDVLLQDAAIRSSGTDPFPAVVDAGNDIDKTDEVFEDCISTFSSRQSLQITNVASDDHQISDTVIEGVVVECYTDNQIEDVTSDNHSMHNQIDGGKDINRNDCDAQPVVSGAGSVRATEPKTVNICFDGTAVACMQKWKIHRKTVLPDAAQNKLCAAPGKVRAKRMYTRRNNAPSSGARRDVSTQPVNVKEALRAVLLSETRDFRTKAEKKKSKLKSAATDKAKNATIDSDLSNEDRQQLERWSRMQHSANTNQTIGFVMQSEKQRMHRTVVTVSKCVPILPKPSTTVSKKGTQVDLGQCETVACLNGTVIRSAQNSSEKTDLGTETRLPSAIFAESQKFSSENCPTLQHGSSIRYYDGDAAFLCSNTCLVSSTENFAPKSVDDANTFQCQRPKQSLTITTVDGLPSSNSKSSTLSDFDIDSAHLNALVDSFVVGSDGLQALNSASSTNDRVGRVLLDYSVDKLENLRTLEEICSSSSNGGDVLLPAVVDLLSDCSGERNLRLLTSSSLIDSPTLNSLNSTHVCDQTISASSANQLILPTSSKGSASGYGVGVYLEDEVVGDSDQIGDYTSGAGMSVESASLLSEWMTVTRSLNTAELESILMEQIESNI